MMCIYSGILLSSFIFSVEDNEKGRYATQYSIINTYESCGIKAQVEPKLKQLEQQYTPEILQKFGLSATVLYRIVKDQKIEYAWSF